MKKTIKLPTYRRQRFLLYFLEYLSTGQTGEPSGISRMDLQKLLFLYCLEMRSSHYNFVPWERGGHSFQCEADLNSLEKQGWIKTQENRLFLNKRISIDSWGVGSEERERIRGWIRRCPWRGKALVKRTYQLHPYYAYYSKIKMDLLNTEELEKVEHSVDVTEGDEVVVFTLGYEGIHFETYLNKLVSNRIALLCDVRRNPLSRKFGFSAAKLSSVLPKLDIEYRHFPELGIVSEKRKTLNTKEDYEVLFQHYCQNLMDRQDELRCLRQIIESKRRVALTCFEADPGHCHRHCISDFLESEYHYRVEHL